MRLVSWNTGRRTQVREQAEALLGREPDVVALQEVKGREIRRRFDHVFASRSLGPQECTYLHAWREGTLSDHAAIETVFRPAAEGTAADEPGRRRG